MRVFLAAAAAIMLSACAQQQVVESPEALVARGDYLVNNVVLCGDCHTPHTPQGPDLARRLQGAELPMEATIPIPFANVAPQIAGIPEGYSEAQFVHFLQTGERPSGAPVMAPMPPYRLNDSDARAVAAYIATLPKAGS